MIVRFHKPPRSCCGVSKDINCVIPDLPDPGLLVGWAKRLEVESGECIV